MGAVSNGEVWVVEGKESTCELLTDDTDDSGENWVANMLSVHVCVCCVCVC